VYVDSLVRHLEPLGIESAVAAPTRGESTAYRWNGVEVFRYKAPDPAGVERRDPPDQEADEFETWLRAQAADVYHQHTWLPACGLEQLSAAKRLGLKTVLTVHIPSLICLRGTMMLNGVEPCDGRVDVARCTRCWGTSRGIPAPVASWQARFPGASEALGRRLPATRLRTALLTPSFVTRRQADLVEVGKLADRVVAVCHWLYDALASNGFPAEKLVYCAQGIETTRPSPTPARRSGERDTLRVGFLGRWEWVKGIHVLVEAFRVLPSSVAAELIVHALPSDPSYERKVRALAHGEKRIRFEPPVARLDIGDTLAGFDVLAVPSLWMETGPLVVLEAFAAGVPVIGSNLGGIAELVDPGVNGTLVRAGDVAAWTQAVADIASDRCSLSRLTPAPPSSTARVAQEMSSIYRVL
jgi:glycosyltransferase involved in cell wall biosynthesis